MDKLYDNELINKVNEYIRNYNLPIIPCENKRPMWANWKNKEITDAKLLKRYTKSSKNLTVGLVLGQPSNIIGVDIDGDEALNHYLELSGGELQNTWTFKTPNKGFRLLFSISEDVIAKKHTIPFKGVHNELAFLGEGQLTIMPPSVINGVGCYEWIEGRSPNDCDLQPAPQFILDFMCKSKPKLQVNSDSNDIIETLCDKCRVFNKDYLTQRNEGLHEERWFLWISLLTKIGDRNCANLFSSISSKHDERSIERINKLAEDNSSAMVKCTTFGCTAEQIAKCHEKIIRNKKNQDDIKNSPGYFGKTDNGEMSIDYEKIGLNTDEGGKLKSINGNKFADHILENYILKYSNEDLFYQYLNDNDSSRLFRDFLHKYFPDSWSVHKEVSYIEALKRVTPKVKQMNQEKNYINLVNGIFDLRAFGLIPHSENFLTTIRVPIEYDSNADCPRFKQFLDEIFESDKDRISVVQEIMGYCLTPETKAQKAFIFYGQGSNGKSVLLNIITKLVGMENVSSVPFDELNNSFARYDLLNKTVNIVTETEVDSKGFNSQYFKAIVGGDPIRLEIKGGASFTYSPICKILLGVNNPPYSKDKSLGFTRRLLIVPFNKIFSSKEADKSLSEKLEKELPGILNFALDGLKRLQENNYEFTDSDTIKSILDEYKKSINPFESFVNEMIEGDEIDSKVSYVKIGEAYSMWREENGYSEHTLSHNALAANLKVALRTRGIGFGTARNNSYRFLTGIKMKNEKGKELISEVDDDIYEEVESIEDIA